MSIEIINQIQHHHKLNAREIIDFIPEDKVFKFNYKLLGGNARRQIKSYLRRIRFQRNMKRVYIFEINKLILNEALTSIIKLINFKF